MAESTKKYAYEINGRKITILVYDEGTGLYVTPNEDDENAIYLKYSTTYSDPNDEESDIGVSGLLALAVVSYVKSCLLSVENPMLSRKFYNDFLRYVSMAKNNRYGAPRVVVPRGPYVLK